MRSRTRKKGALKDTGEEKDEGRSDAREEGEGAGRPGMVVILLLPATGDPVPRLDPQGRVR
jgi:hypothetical protein